jgi:hypothetical protein
MNTASSAVSTGTWISRPAQRTSLAPSPRYGQIRSSFQPHPLLRGAHLQTIASHLRPAPTLVLRRERLELPDGDFVDLGWSGDQNKTGPLAVLVHGLCGGFDSKYARGTACQLIARGWSTVILKLRGAGPEPNRLQRCYNQGDTEDLRYFWHLLREREPHAFIATVGWSLGGNVTLKASEGLAKMFASTLRAEFKRNWLTRIAGLIAMPVLNAFKRRFDPRRYNGATLLGLKGVVVKSHGSADRFAFEHAIETACDEVRNNVLKRITDQIQLLQRVAA